MLHTSLQSQGVSTTFNAPAEARGFPWGMAIIPMQWHTVKVGCLTIEPSPRPPNKHLNTNQGFNEYSCTTLFIVYITFIADNHVRELQPSLALSLSSLGVGPLPRAWDATGGTSWALRRHFIALVVPAHFLMSKI